MQYPTTFSEGFLSLLSQMHASARREFRSSNYSCVDLVEDQKGTSLHRILSGGQGLAIYPKVR